MSKKKEKKSTGEIDKLIADFDNKHNALHTRMDADFDLWRLSPYKLDDYSDNVTSTYPRFYAQAILGQLSGAKIILTIHRMDGDKDAESQMERSFYGWLRTIDENLVARLLPPLQSTVSFMAAIRGFISGRIIFKDIPEIFPYDARYLSYGIDSKGVIWSGYTTYREPYAIEFEYGITPKPRKDEPKKAIKVIEWIDQERYAVVVDNEFATDDVHDWKRPPVVIVPVGCTPLIVSTGDKYDYVAEWGDSIYGSSRSLYPVQSKVMSIWMSLLAKSHKPSYFGYTADGQMKTQGTPWGKGEILWLPIDAKMEQVKPPDIASSAPNFYQVISGLIAQGDYPSLFYGQLWKGQELSGKMMESVTQNLEQIKGTLLQAMSTFYKTSLKKLGEQFALTSNPMMVSGNDRMGRRFVDTATPDLFIGDYDLTVEFKSMSPEQEAANYAKGQIAKSAGLASDNFIREEIVQFQDPEKIKREMYIENVEKLSPRVYMLRAIDALKAEGKEQEAAILEGEFKLSLAQMIPQGQPGQPQGGQPPNPTPNPMGGV